MAHTTKNPKKNFQPNTKGSCSHSSNNNFGNAYNVTHEVSKNRKYMIHVIIVVKIIRRLILH